MNTLHKLAILGYKNVAQDSQSWEHFARQLMTDPHFLAYIDKHGYHFTPALADHITRNYMQNADGSEHNWTTAQVQSAMEQYGMTQNDLKLNWADAAYLANWYYSDEYPEFLTSEKACITRAYRAANDPDGYEGMTFARWLSDAVGHRIDIDWQSYT